MPAPLSVIIPTLNAEKEIGPCLERVFEGVSAGIVAEVIFADGGSGPEMARLAEELGAEVIVSEAGRGTQLAAGCAAAKAPWFLILHADTRLPEGWPAIVQQAFHDPDKAYFARLTFDAQGFGPWMVAAWANFRSTRLGLPYGDQGLLISRMLFRRIGGYADIPLMEDVAISKALGRQKQVLDMSVTTSFKRYAKDGWLRRGMRNLSYLIRYKLGANPQDLAARYRRH